MQPVEKNDVDISRLFHYGEKFDIKDKNDKKVLTAYIRLVGDSELNQARVFALRSSADLRDKLRDKSSDEHRAFIPSTYDELDNSILVDTILMYTAQEVTNDVIKELNIPLPKEPKSDATLEEQEDYQKQVDAFPLYRLTLIREEVDKRLTKFRDNLLIKSREEIINEYERIIVLTLCQQEMMNKFKEMSTYFGCFKDKYYKERLFDSFESFTNILPEYKEQLIDNYMSLELSSDELKK